DELAVANRQIEAFKKELESNAAVSTKLARESEARAKEIASLKKSRQSTVQERDKAVAQLMQLREELQKRTEASRAVVETDQRNAGQQIEQLREEHKKQLQALETKRQAAIAARDELQAR